MVKKTISRTQAKKQIKEFFEDLKGKTPKEVRKIRRLAMGYNIKLEEKKKLFCKKCFAPYNFPGVKIKNDLITISCDSCDHKSRWKIKSS